MLDNCGQLFVGHGAVSIAELVAVKLQPVACVEAESQAVQIDGRAFKIKLTDGLIGRADCLVLADWQKVACVCLGPVREALTATAADGCDCLCGPWLPA